MNVSFTTRLIDHQHQFFLARLIVSVLVSRTIRHTDLKLLNVSVLCFDSSVQQLWRGQSLPGQRKRQVSPRHDRLPIADHLPAVEQHGGRCQVSGLKQEVVRSAGPPRLLRVLKGFLSLLMFDWFNETLEQKFKRTESSVGELTAAGAAGKCLQN